MEQSISEVPKVSPEQVGHDFRNKTYEIKSTRINVSWKEFSPIPKEPKEGKPLAEIPQDEAILFLPGWSAKTAETINHLTQAFANDSGRTALSITTRPEKVVPDSLYKEAAAIRNLIVEKGLRKIILAAHSEGGIKAVDLISILQKDQNIKVEGLILLDPVGLYEQGKMELALKFSLDTLISTSITLTKNLRKNPSLILKYLQASSDIIFNMAKEMAKTKGIGYPAKLWSQIGEMAKANTHYQDVKCPVVLIQGADDPVSSADRIISKEERARYAQEAKERVDHARDLAKRFKTDRFSHDPAWRDERNQAVQKAFFPNSPDVHWLVPEKIGHHGLPYFREESISNASIGLLKRFLRTHQSPAQPASQPATVPASQGNTLQN